MHCCLDDKGTNKTSTPGLDHLKSASKTGHTDQVLVLMTFQKGHQDKPSCVQLAAGQASERQFGSLQQQHYS